MEPSQFKLVLEDMLADLGRYSVWDIERAAADWRTSGEQFFPTASGALIKKIQERAEASIASARAARPTYRTPQIESDRKYPYQLKPWREILAAHGKPIPPADSKLAVSLDALQTKPDRRTHKRSAGQPRENG